MAFPNSFECKFSRITATPAKTLVDIKVYRVVDGGLDSIGNQIYIRTLWRTQSHILDAGWDAPRLVAYFKNQLNLWNLVNAFGYAQANQICTL